MIVESPYTRPIQIGSATLGGWLPFVLIAGPAVAKNGDAVTDALSLAATLASYTRERDVPFIFRLAPSDQADASAPEFEETLEVLREIRSRLGIPVAVQVSDAKQVAKAAKTADLLQIPAVHCRQADLLAEAAHTGRPVNIEMGALLPPDEAVNLLDSVAGMGNWNVALTDCRTRFSDAAVDVAQFTTMRESGFPLVVDAGPKTDLAETALGAGVDGICLLVQDDEIAGGAGVPVTALPRLLHRLKEIERSARS
jgi:2-dehydro-3-deoxyphosphooctonate aldolase (KDO 8-P synthase)